MDDVVDDGIWVVYILNVHEREDRMASFNQMESRVEDEEEGNLEEAWVDVTVAIKELTSSSSSCSSSPPSL